MSNCRCIVDDSDGNCPANYWMCDEPSYEPINIFDPDDFQRNQITVAIAQPGYEDQLGRRRARPVGQQPDWQDIVMITTTLNQQGRYSRNPYCILDPYEKCCTDPEYCARNPDDPYCDCLPPPMDYHLLDELDQENVGQKQNNNPFCKIDPSSRSCTDPNIEVVENENRVGYTKYIYHRRV